MQILQTIAVAILMSGAIWANSLDKTGRPVRILSLSFHDKPLSAIRDLIDQ